MCSYKEGGYNDTPTSVLFTSLYVFLLGQLLKSMVNRLLNLLRFRSDNDWIDCHSFYTFLRVKYFIFIYNFPLTSNSSL